MGVEQDLVIEGGVSGVTLHKGTRQSGLRTRRQLDREDATRTKATLAA